LATKGLSSIVVKDIIANTDKAIFTLDEKRVASHYKKILETIRAIQMNTYFQVKYRWSDATVKTIWWDIHGSAIMGFPITKRVSIQKFLIEALRMNKKIEFTNSDHLIVPYVTK
jgi:hypothetical protein